MTARRGALWTELPEAGIIPEAGNAAEWETGSWRNQRPIRDNDVCTDCLQCWAYCPDVAILCIDGHVKGTEYDYRYCKGCGICADICPVKCITMVPEAEARQADAEQAAAAVEGAP
jgi:pyruvate ferredoxin oxidoreductase delta subunit